MSKRNGVVSWILLQSIEQFFQVLTKSSWCAWDDGSLSTQRRLLNPRNLLGATLNIQTPQRKKVYTWVSAPWRGGGVGPCDCLKMNCQLPVEFIIHPHQDISCRCWCRGRKSEENAFHHPTQQFLRDWNIPPTCDWLTQPQSMNVKIHLWLSSHSNILRLCTLSHWLFWTEPVSLFLLTDWFM